MFLKHRISGKQKKEHSSDGSEGRFSYGLSLTPVR